MPLIGYEDFETRKFFIDNIIEKKYKFKCLVYLGFEKEKSTLELADLKAFETIVRSLNVSLLAHINYLNKIVIFFSQQKEIDSICSNSLRIYSYSGRPDKVLNAIELGFDLFTGSYPYLVTIKNEAILFDVKMVENSDEDEIPTKRRRLNTPKVEAENETTIDLSDKKYLETIYINDCF